jgi:hypothetical protein
MNAIPFETLDIYEFFCDHNLIDKVMTEVTGPDIIWQNTIHPGEFLSQYGYLNIEKDVPYYHPELFTWIQECVDKVAEKHYKNFKLSIVDSWLTRNQFRERPGVHLHYNSVISGLLYFSDFKKSKTVFIQPDLWSSQFLGLKPILKGIVPIQKEITIAPEKGKLILWRSDISHTIQPHTDIKNKRYTLAFNTYFDGVICDYPTAKLKLKIFSVKDQYEEYIKNKND